MIISSLQKTNKLKLNLPNNEEKNYIDNDISAKYLKT